MKMNVEVIETTICYESGYRYYVFDTDNGKHIDTFDVLESNRRKARAEFRKYAKDVYDFKYIKK